MSPGKLDSLQLEGSVWVAVSQGPDVQQQYGLRKWAGCSVCSVVRLPKALSASRNRARPNTSVGEMSDLTDPGNRG